MDNTASAGEIHKRVREEFTVWAGARRPVSSMTVTFAHDPSGTKTHIWTYSDGDKEEHLVVYMRNLMFTHWEIKYGDVSDIVRAHIKQRSHPQAEIGLPKAG